MPTCKRCGKKHSIFVHALGTGLCYECDDSDRKAAIYKTQLKAITQAHLELEKILTKHVPVLPVEQAGIASWEAGREGITSFVGRNIMFSSIGILQTSRLPKYTYGILAADDNTFYIIELGTKATEEITPLDISSSSLHPNVYKYPFDKIRTQWTSPVLGIRGIIGLDAKFSDSFGEENVAKGERIDRVLRRCL